MKKKIFSWFFWGSMGTAVATVIASSCLFVPNYNYQRQISNNVLQTKSDVEQNANVFSPKKIDPKDPLHYLAIENGVVKGFVEGFVVPDNFDLVIPATDAKKVPIKKVADQAFCGHSDTLTEKDFQGQKIGTLTVKKQFTTGSIRSVTLADSVEEIGDAAFYGNTLININFGSKLKTLGRWTFAYCQTLTKLSLPKGLLTIGFGAFAWTGYHGFLFIPDGVTKIGGQAFYFSDSITDVYIPDSVKEIGEEAFDIHYGEAAVKRGDFNIYVFAKNLNFGWQFVNVENSDSSLLHAWVMDTDTQNKIASMTHVSGVPIFSGDNINLMQSLENLLIAGKNWDQVAGLTEKGKKANEITVSSSITKILSFAFHNCSSSLKKIVVTNKNIKFDRDCFFGVPNDVKYVVYSDAAKKQLIDMRIDEKNISVKRSSQLSAAWIVGITVGSIAVAVIALGLGIGLPMRKQHKINILNTKLNGKRIEKLSMANALAFKKVIETTGALDRKVDKLTSGMMSLKAAQKKATTKPSASKVVTKKAPVHSSTTSKSARAEE